MILGIDFGTSRTVAASSTGADYALCRFDCHGKFVDYIPSLIAFKDGAIKFGWEAASCKDDPNAYLMRSLKRLVGYYPPDLEFELAPDVRTTVLELAALYLDHVRRMLRDHSSLNIEKDAPVEVMIAAPANANTNQRYITLEAFKRAGFTVKGMLNEPTAAAMEFSQRYLKKPGTRSPEKYVAVYDLGAGTFDASVIELADNRCDVITHEGISALGGDDIDRVIFDLVLQKLGKQRDVLNRSDQVRLLEACRRNKEGISGFTRKLAIDVSRFFDQEKKVVIDKKEIHSRCEPIIQQSIDALETAIERADLSRIDAGDKRKLDAIYITGGAAGLPLVSKKLRDQFGKKVRISPSPRACAALGLAISADPARSASFRESVSRNLGVWRECGTNKTFDTIIEKSRRLMPQSGALKVKRRYNPIHNIGHLRFIECSSLGPSGQPGGDIADISEIFFPYDPQLKNEKDLHQVPVTSRPDLAGQEVTETYSYDARGIITVEVENRSAQYKKTYILSRRALPAELSTDL